MKAIWFKKAGWVYFGTCNGLLFGGKGLQIIQAKRKQYSNESQHVIKTVENKINHNGTGNSNTDHTDF